MCLVTVLSAEECSQFDSFRWQHVQMFKAPTFKTTLIDHNAGEQS